MPAHPKTNDRREYDNYSTPYWAIRALLDDYKLTIHERESPRL